MRPSNAAEMYWTKCDTDILCASVVLLRPLRTKEIIDRARVATNTPADHKAEPVLPEQKSYWTLRCKHNGHATHRENANSAAMAMSGECSSSD